MACGSVSARTRWLTCRRLSSTTLTDTHRVGAEADLGVDAAGSACADFGSGLVARPVGRELRERCGRVGFAVQEGAELLDRAHQRRREHNGGVLVDCDLYARLQVA